MDSLANYGSDDDYDSTEDRSNDTRNVDRNYKKPNAPETDTNYDEVGMDLSEDSDAEKPSSRRTPPESRSKRSDRECRSSPKPREDTRSSRKDEERGKYSRDDRNRDREHGSRSNRDDRNGRNDRERDDRDRNEDRHESRSDDRHKSDDREDRRHRDRDSYRKRSRSRDRRRSRSPRRSRSRSRDRGRGGYSKRFDRASYKMDKLDKMGIDLKASDRHYIKPADQAADEGSGSKDRFFMPGITGRFRDQIERRKLLWQKKAEPEKKPEAPVQPLGGPGGSRSTKVWETTTFAQDSDGKVANKFKRLMGIRSSAEGAGSASDVLKKQEEMFSSMEQQYEVARTATHTMRGVGLGFGSFQK